MLYCSDSARIHCSAYNTFKMTNPHDGKYNKYSVSNGDNAAHCATANLSAFKSVYTGSSDAQRW